MSSVGRVLEIKGRAVVTATAGQTLQEASRLMAEFRIGALVVSGPDGSVAGILSERDIVRAVSVGSGAALNDSVGKHMTARVITCTEASAIHEVMAMMSAGKFRHVPVVRDGRLDGMISIGDVVKHRLAELETESQALREYIAAS